VIPVMIIKLISCTILGAKRLFTFFDF